MIVHEAPARTTGLLFPTVGVEDYGSISIRVVVLPRKAEQDEDAPQQVILDLDADETVGDDESSPINSYLERPKRGKLCCVFLVNGQRQDGLDNSLIVQHLGFKYLRKRMMIIVEVDGLTPHALGKLMQGSRQGFYKGDVWDAIHRRLVSTLKNDPDLLKIEEEAEAEVAQLGAGDDRVREALDHLIDTHHDYADHDVVDDGPAPGDKGQDLLSSDAKPMNGEVVTLEKPNLGEAAGLPVLGSKSGSSCLIRPFEEKVLTVTTNPANAWPALASLATVFDPPVPELQVTEERGTEGVRFKLVFRPGKEFDDDDYPVRSVMKVFAKFNGVKETRHLPLGITIKPASPPPEPILHDDPAVLRVTSKQPVKLYRGDADTHVRLRWDGKDELALGPSPAWTFTANCGSPTPPTSMTFSQPRRGKFSLAVGIGDVAGGTQLNIQVTANGPNGKSLSVEFVAVVTERIAPTPPEPRLLTDKVPVGAVRRPPYRLKIVKREDWDTGTCWEGMSWTDMDAAAYQEPTATAPLTLLINEDFGPLEHFRKTLVGRKMAETEVQTRLRKYTTHIAFHLYQMFQAQQERQGKQGETPLATSLLKAETNRVALTLIKVMQVSH